MRRRTKEILQICFRTFSLNSTCNPCLSFRTNTDPERSRYIRDHLSDFPGITEVYSSGIFGIAKPDQEFFKKIQVLEELEPNQIFFIDDSEKNVLGARNVGWGAHLFSDNSTTRILHSIQS